MSINKKYFYLKFKEDYFSQDHIQVIEAMENGYIYSLIILKLYLKSLKWEGQLRINETIPYMKDKIDILAKVIGHDSDHVMKAINLAISFGIIKVINTGEIFMADIHNFIGQSSTEGDRKKLYRNKLDQKQLTDNSTGGQNTDKCPDKCPPELELELDKELYGELNNVLLTEKEYKKLIKDYGEKVIINYINRLSLYEKIDNYSDHNRTIRKWLNKDDIPKQKKLEVPESSKIDLKEVWL
jgi:predicted phage replisome organizer